jgi:hypothetical protein
MRLEVGDFTVGWTALKIVLNKMVKHEISCSVNQHISSNRGCKPFQKSSKNNAWSNRYYKLCIIFYLGDTTLLCIILGQKLDFAIQKDNIQASNFIFFTINL